MSWIKKLKHGLGRSASKISTGISVAITHKKLDDELLSNLEDVLISSDIGVHASMALVEGLRAKKYEKDISEEEVKRILADEIAEMLTPVACSLEVDKDKKPYTILMVGVNGSGKTTTIGKLAHNFKQEKHSVTLVAGDTFRAAAVEQLKVWGERNKCQVITGEPNSDPASVAYRAYGEMNTEILMIDTAGRLQNKTNLMAELEKIIRVIKKHDETAPHEVLLVLDATVGQNAHSQVEAFRDIAGVTGLIVTKLDGTAKGGVVVSLADKFQLPIYAIGVGEGIDDLHPFNPQDFANSLVGLET